MPTLNVTSSELILGLRSAHPSLTDHGTVDLKESSASDDAAVRVASADHSLDFQHGQDLIDFTNVSRPGSFSAVVAHAAQTTDGTLLDTGVGSSVQLHGVAVSSLTASDFVHGRAPTPGDFNGDGKTDIIYRYPDGSVVEWASQSSSSIYFVNTIGTPSLSMQLQLAGNPQDFNGDGKSDLLFRGVDGSMQMWLSNSSGGFDNLTLPTVTSEWHLAGAGDFDGDGLSDLVWRLDNGDVQLWLHPGSAAGFTRVDLGVTDPSYRLEAIGDFNGDGAADMLFRNDSTGDSYLDLSSGPGLNFTRLGIGSVPSEWHIQGAADFNGDGTADILWRSDSGQTELWLSPQWSQFEPKGPFTYVNLGSVDNAWAIQQLGDFNGDGLADILWRHNDGSLQVWTANPGGASFGQTEVPGGVRAGEIKPGGLRATDVNLDGKADIIAVSASGGMQAWLMGSTPGSLAGAMTLPSLSAGETLELQGRLPVDFNLDGLVDFLVQGPQYQEIHFVNGSQTTGVQRLSDVPSGEVAQAAADFNGDGAADILWRNPTTGDVGLSVSAIHPLNWTFQSLGAVGTNWTVLTAGDFNGDGKADILWQDGSGDLNLWLSNSSALSFSHMDLGAMGPGRTVAGAADLNGDGKLDLLWRNTSTGDVQMWTSKPDTVAFDHVDLGVAPSDWSVAQVEDFTGDGRADILWRDSKGDTSLWVSTPGQSPFIHYAGPTISTDWHIV